MDQEGHYLTDAGLLHLLVIAFNYAANDETGQYLTEVVILLTFSKNCTQISGDSYAFLEMIEGETKNYTFLDTLASENARYRALSNKVNDIIAEISQVFGSAFLSEINNRTGRKCRVNWDVLKCLVGQSD